MLRTTLELARPLLFALDPENAHELTLRTLEAGLYPRADKPDDPRLNVKLWDLEFPNPIGIAAGFDKDARVPDALLRIGFGFAEIGTVTPRPQPGNPRPRVFRLIGHRAIINRLGFNSAGHDPALRRLQRRPRLGVVGVNIGANKESADRTADYVLGLETFYDVASYLTVNISSPTRRGCVICRRRQLTSSSGAHGGPELNFAARDECPLSSKLPRTSQRRISPPSWSACSPTESTVLPFPTPRWHGPGYP